MRSRRSSTSTTTSSSTARRRSACSRSTRWRRADSVLIPLQCEYYALEGLVPADAHHRAGASRASTPRSTVEGILLTMFDARANIAHQVADEVRGYFPDLVFKAVVPRNVRLAESPSLRQADHPLRHQVQGLRELPAASAREIMRREQGQRQEAPTRRLRATWHKETPTDMPTTLKMPMPSAAGSGPSGAASPRRSGRRPRSAPTGRCKSGRARCCRSTIHRDPLQPRRDFDRRRSTSSPSRFKTQGVLQPVLVRKDGSRLPAHRRRAPLARLAEGRPQGDSGDRPRGDRSEAFELALVENLQRADLNPIEEAEGYQRLIEERRSPRSRWPSASARRAPAWRTRCGCSPCPTT